MNTIKLVIYATHDDGYFNVLVQNAVKLGFDVQIIGWGTEWEGFYKRTMYLYDFFKSCDDEDVIMCIDGFDSYVTDTCDNTYTKFIDISYPIVWGTEKNHMVKKYIFKSKYNYTLNGGTFIGINSHLKKVFAHIVDVYGYTNYKQDDQKIINAINNSEIFNSIIYPDIQCKIFANITYDSIVHYIYNFFGIKIDACKLSHVICSKTSTIIDKHTGITPSVISGPGNVNIHHLIKFSCENYTFKERHKYNSFLLYNFKLEILSFIVLLLVIIIGIFIILSILVNKKRYNKWK